MSNIHPSFTDYRLNIEDDGKYVILNKRFNNKIELFENSNFFEVYYFAKKKVNTSQFILECKLQRPLKKNEVVQFYDDNEFNFRIENLYASEMPKVQNKYFIKVIDENKEESSYKTISSASRATNVRGKIISLICDNEVDCCRNKYGKVYKYMKIDINK